MDMDACLHPVRCINMSVSFEYDSSRIDNLYFFMLLYQYNKARYVPASYRIDHGQDERGTRTTARCAYLSLVLLLCLTGTVACSSVTAD